MVYFEKTESADITAGKYAAIILLLTGTIMYWLGGQNVALASILLLVVILLLSYWAFGQYTIRVIDECIEVEFRFSFFHFVYTLPRTPLMEEKKVPWWIGFGLKTRNGEEYYSVNNAPLIKINCRECTVWVGTNHSLRLKNAILQAVGYASKDR